MNEQLIKFIELCLIDGIITDKEREVIFRKSKYKTYVTKHPKSSNDPTWLPPAGR